MNRRLPCTSHCVQPLAGGARGRRFCRAGWVPVAEVVRVHQEVCPFGVPGQGLQASTRGLDPSAHACVEIWIPLSDGGHERIEGLGDRHFRLGVAGKEDPHGRREWSSVH